MIIDASNGIESFFRKDNILSNSVSEYDDWTGAAIPNLPGASKKSWESIKKPTAEDSSLQEKQDWQNVSLREPWFP